MAAALAILCATRIAFADPLADLEKAHSAYVAHKYDDAELRLRALLDSGALKDNPNDLADARMYLGAVLVDERRKEEADEIFEKLLLDRPLYSPDQLRVSSDAVNAFLDTQARLRDRLRQIQEDQAEAERKRKVAQDLARQKAVDRLALLERLASEERVIEKNSRWWAILPFGVGQFQNRQTDLGWAFLSAEALLAVGSAVAAVVSVYEQGLANDSLSVDFNAAQDYRNTAFSAAVAADVLAGGFLLTAIVGAVHAEATFVPEIVHIRKRPIPTLSLSPVVGPTGVGLAGRF